MINKSGSLSGCRSAAKGVRERPPRSESTKGVDEMAERESVKVLKAALDEDGADIILRGVIAPDSLHLLQVDDYQREILPFARIRDLVGALENGNVPDIVLGMRGGAYHDRDGVFYLQDPVFIIDGLQRTTAAKHLLMKGGREPRLGVKVHFNTSKE